MPIKIFENEKYVIRLEERTDKKLAIFVNLKDENGKELIPNGYVLGSNTLLKEF